MPYGCLCLLCKDILEALTRFHIPNCPSLATGRCTRQILSKDLKTLKDGVWTVDGRFDSMGYPAKYGAHTMLCTTIMTIVHFGVVQQIFDR